ncbi:hypothetical protein Tco_0791430 [Tanacetum coccineum]
MYPVGGSFVLEYGVLPSSGYGVLDLVSVVFGLTRGVNIRVLAGQVRNFAAMANLSLRFSLLWRARFVRYGRRLAIQLKTITVGTKKMLCNVLEGSNKAREARTVVLNRVHPSRPDWYEEFYARFIDGTTKTYKTEVHNDPQYKLIMVGDDSTIKTSWPPCMDTRNSSSMSLETWLLEFVHRWLGGLRCRCIVAELGLVTHLTSLAMPFSDFTCPLLIASCLPLSTGARSSFSDVCEPSVGGVSDRERVVTHGTLPAEVCNTSVTGVMQRRYVTSCLGNSSANESVSQPFLAHGVPRLKNSRDGVAASTVRSDIWRGIRNRVVTDASKRVVTNSFHTTDYESTLSSSSSQLPANIANCSDASAFGLEASYNLNALSCVPATSAGINSRGSNIGARHSASMRIRGLSRSSIRVSTPGTSIDISTLNLQCCSSFNGQRGLSRQRSPASGGESVHSNTNVRRRLSYGDPSTPTANIPTDFEDRTTHVPESSSRGVSRQRSPAMSSRSGDFNINVRRRLSSTQSNLTPTTLPVNLGNRNTNVPELSFARTEGSRSSYVVIPQRILILATVAIDVITMGIYFGMVNGLKVYHRIGSLCPENGHPPCFLQLYIYDMQNEVGNRMHHFDREDEGVLNPDIVERLIHILDDHN